MVVSYTNSRWDLMAFVGNCVLRSPLCLAWIGILIATILWSTSSFWSLDLPVALRFLAVLTFAVFVVGSTALLIFVTLLLLVSSRSNRTIVTGHTVSLSQEGVTDETIYSRNLQKWPGVQRLLRTRNYLFIYDSETCARIIPRKAFASAHEDDSFYAFCQQKANQRN